MRVYLQEMLPVSAEGESARRFPYCFYQAKCFSQGQGQRSSPRRSSNMLQQSCREYKSVAKKNKQRNMKNKIYRTTLRMQIHLQDINCGGVILQNHTKYIKFTK